MTVRVITDSAAALPAELCRELDIGVVPLTVVVDGVSHDDVGLEPAGLIGRDAVSTSGPSPGAFAAAIAERAGPDGVLVLTVSAELSPERDVLWVHTLSTEDESELIQLLKTRYERRIEEMFS